MTSHSRNRRERGDFSADYKKRSGCRAQPVKTKAGREYICVYGWNFSQDRGLIEAIASPTKNAKVAVSQSGKEWIPYVVKVTNKRTLQVSFVNGMFEKSSKRVYLKDLNMVMSPSGGRGGYFGRHISNS